MSRYRGPKLRITRRLGTLPGLTQKQSKKKDRPGQHGKGSEGKKKTTEYGIRLEEKQKLKFNYGLTESQLFRYIKEARRRNGVTGLILLQLLEMRLDSICFSLGFASTMGAFSRAIQSARRERRLQKHLFVWQFFGAATETCGAIRPGGAGRLGQPGCRRSFQCAAAVDALPSYRDQGSCLPDRSTRERSARNEYADRQLARSDDDVLSA